MSSVEIKCIYETNQVNLMHFYMGWYPLLKAYNPNSHRLVVNCSKDSMYAISAGTIVNKEKSITIECEQADGEALIFCKDEFDSLNISYMQYNFIWNGLNISLKKQIIKGCKDIIEFYSRLIEYPYKSFTFVAEDNLQYAFCQSGLLIFDSYIIKEWNIKDIKAYISHEIAHNWWGSRFNRFTYDLTWLYDGIADYYELLYRLEFYGEDNMKQKIKELKVQYEETTIRNDVFGCIYLLKLEEIIGQSLLVELIKKIYIECSNIFRKSDLEKLVTVYIGISKGE